MLKRLAPVLLGLVLGIAVFHWMSANPSSFVVFVLLCIVAFTIRRMLALYGLIKD